MLWHSQRDVSRCQRLGSHRHIHLDALPLHGLQGDLLCRCAAGLAVQEGGGGGEGGRVC